VTNSTNVKKGNKLLFNRISFGVTVVQLNWTITMQP